MYDPRAIGNLILDEGQRKRVTVSNLALQKLLYFAHALFLVQHKRPLVSGYFEAWTNGPVHPVVYHVFKSAGAQPIDFRASGTNALTGEKTPLVPPQELSVTDHIEQVMMSYGPLSTGRLVALSHAKGAPWDFVVEASRQGVGLGLRIPNDVIVQKFQHHKVSVAAVPKAGEPSDDAPILT